MDLQDHNEIDIDDDASSSAGAKEDETDPSSMFSNNGAVDRAERDKRRKAFIEREEKHVRKVRRAVAVAVLTFAVVVSTSVFVLARNKEHETFTHEFKTFTDHVIANVQWEKNYNFALMEQLGALVTSAALASNATFPNVTVPHFEIEAGYIVGLSAMIACAYAPFVSDNDRNEWEGFAMANEGWVDESITLREINQAHLHPLKGTKDSENYHETAFQGSHSEHEHDEDHHDEQPEIGKSMYSKSIYHWQNGTALALEEHASPLYAPIWQITPPVPWAINSDLMSDQVFQDLYASVHAKRQTSMSPPAAVGQVFDFLFDTDHAITKLEPHTFIAAPVYDSFYNVNITGMVIGLVSIGSLLDFLFDDGVKGVMVVFTDNCGTRLSYEVDGSATNFLGYEDMHDPSYDIYKRTASVEWNRTEVDGFCHLDLHVYPTASLEQCYATGKPYFYAGIVLLSFILTSALIILYDFTVTKRQEKTMRSALLNGALIESLFPAAVRERLLEDARQIETSNYQTNESNENGLPAKTRPIADFFPSTTIMFADIAGFTAWSSTREPFQVFELLETIYGAFDKLAKQRRIFKVETVGDCYVAASGIPEARGDHAVAMAKFARDCLYKMKSLTKLLEVSLGPDTSALAFRVGLHSGPVTGGVLRGDNARFQLFGDTVNTAARMESTGLPNMIQVSQATADLLIAASKEHWIKPRDEQVFAKGKGNLSTYWLSVGNDRSCSRRSTSSRSQGSEACDITDSVNIDENTVALNGKTKRLVDWNVQVLLRFLKLIVSRRGTSNDCTLSDDWHSVIKPDVAVVDEVAEIIALPEFAKNAGADSDSAVINSEVEFQLHEYVTAIAQMYRNNPFHNFQHASHVTMSVTKLMARIVPTSSETETGVDALALHDHTYGITSDPLTQFACIFAALIHDVDHHGVTNAQLIQEQAPVAITYDGNSVLEQNSVVVAWNLIMEPRFKDFRMALCATSIEAKRFRQLVVNAVMATDIMAPELKAARNLRWSQAFAAVPLVETRSDTINRKATIVIDHMIQASDVCHTMQHWHIYRHWNERLFMEMTKAYKEGRAEKNPADTWYQGEIGFFDFYVIPLAKKLADCGVFGVSSDEYLIYAMKNRDEWVARGEEIVLEMIEKVESKA